MNEKGRHKRSIISGEQRLCPTLVGEEVHFPTKSIAYENRNELCSAIEITEFQNDVYSTRVATSKSWELVRIA